MKPTALLLGLAMLAMGAATGRTTEAPGQRTVYVSRNGTSYHEADCPRLHFPAALSLEEARRTLRPCPVCRIDVATGAGTERDTSSPTEQATAPSARPAAEPVDAGAPPARAGTPPPERDTAAAANAVLPGQRVRLTRSGSEPLIGTVLDLDEEGIVLRTGDQAATQKVPIRSVSRLERSVGQRSRTGRGLAIGAGAGLAFGLALGLLVPVEDSDGWDFFSAEEELAMIAVPVTALGAVIGALVGHSAKEERWDEVPLAGVHLGLVAQPGGRFGIGLRASF